MTLRGILFWPLFAGLSIVLHSYFILGFLTILMGPIYYLWDYKIPRFGFNHGCAELTMGTMLAIIALVKVGTLSIGIL